MTAMVKGRGDESSKANRGEAQLRPRHVFISETNDAFLQAFADALRDILREERRPVA
jgi:hypothetical protein